MLANLELTDVADRLAALREIVRTNYDAILDRPLSEEVNNHVHTHYSFSPYSPSSVVYHARRAGLQAVGSVDHDSIGAAEELIDAAQIVGIGSTVGCELRVSFTDTDFARQSLNNPDTTGNAYIVLHGVPRTRIAELSEALLPIQRARNARNKVQVEALNTILRQAGIQDLDFNRDVLPESLAHENGSVTERHILFALARRLVDVVGRGAPLVDLLKRKFEIALKGRQLDYLVDEDNPHVLYDLLGIFKVHLLPRFFVQPNAEECPSVFEVTELGKRLGAIPAYSYLGDVGESPTGDKAAQQFEDEYVDDLFAGLKDFGFLAVTYMPPRNTLDQLRRVQRLADTHGLLEISGVDINSSRQVFTCPEINTPDFQHLNTSTWALIAHEKLSAVDPRYGFFHPDNPYAGRALRERIALYANIARESDPHDISSMTVSAPRL